MEKRPSPILHAGWWALDYVYAARRQLAFFATPWTARRHRPAPRDWSSGRTDLPEIILVPGVYEHWTFLRPLGNALSGAGYRVSIVHGLGSNRRAVVQTSERLGRALAKTPPGEAGRVLVAHSKGGLIGKHLLVSSGAAGAAAAAAAAGEEPGDAAASAAAPPEADAPNRRPLGLLGLVAVCTPFGGSSLAGLFFVPSIRAFVPHDETIVTLGRETSVNGRIVSIFGRYDPHIPDGSVLEGATNVQVPGTGHFRVLGDAETHRAVIEAVHLLSSH